MAQKKYRVSFLSKTRRDDDDVKYDVTAESFDDAFHKAYEMLKGDFGPSPYDYFFEGSTEEIIEGPKTIGIRFEHTEPAIGRNSENYLGIRAETEEQAIEYYNEHYKGKHFYQPWPHRIDPDGPCVYGRVKETYFMSGPGYHANALKRRVFIDMDGTLAEFKPTSKLEDLYEENYFRDLKPYNEVVNAAKELIKDPDIEVFILSAVLTDSQYALKEKNEWLDQYLPEIDKEHRVFMPCGTDKKEYVPDGIKKTDILLDDYTKNLNDWEPPAVGLKLLNGINDTNQSWAGERVTKFWSGKELAENIRSFALGYGVKGKIVHDLKTGINHEMTAAMETERAKLISEGLKPERFDDMLSEWNYGIKGVKETIADWGIDKCNKGYDIFDFDGTGMLEIEAIGDVGRFTDDDGAVMAAIKDGIKVIPVHELPLNFHRDYLGWIDTPENRQAIEEYCDAEKRYANDSIDGADYYHNRLRKEIGVTKEEIHSIMWFAYGQSEGDFHVYFIYGNEIVLNPWIDKEGNPISEETAINTFGMENVRKFCKEALEYLGIEKVNALDLGITEIELEAVKEFAEKQWEDFENIEKENRPYVSFEYQGMDITNPWIDESGRFPLSDADAISEYGLINIKKFCTEALGKIRDKQEGLVINEDPIPEEELEAYKKEPGLEVEKKKQII